MCGITGIISSSVSSPEKLKGLELMSSLLSHRGPDSAGSYSHGQVAFAMRRLSIIDLPGGSQPLFSEDGSLALVANGEIYNHLELRAELESRGHVFKTRSDCETILHLYEESGPGCLLKLRGMFAFALHDKRKNEVLLARDRMGEKPLYYHRCAGEVAFSSEMKSLLAYLRPRGLQVDAGALNMFLHYQYVPEPRTCVKGVMKLPAAHYALINAADLSFSLKRYWDMEDAPPVTGDPAELIRAGFDELGKLIIGADVPVGVALSGGLDSSAIAVAASKHDASGLTAFTVGYPGRPGFDERGDAEKLARRLGMKFCGAELTTGALEGSFPDLVRAMDDPIADVAAYGYYAVSRLARESGVPVLLFGFGGDELFWGYRWARESLRWNYFKKELRSGRRFRGLPAGELMRVLGRAEKRAILSRPLGVLSGIASDISELAGKYTSNPDRLILWDENQDFRAASRYKKDLFSPVLWEGTSEDELCAPFTTADWDHLEVKTCRFLFDPWNVSNAVPLGDRLGMAASVENRLPFLDHKFVELVIGLRKSYPGDYRLGSKGWFRQAMRGYIPDEVLDRPKTGFTPPREEWLRLLVRRYGEACLEGPLVSMGLIKKDALRDFFASAGPGGSLFFAYKVLLLDMWLDMFVRGVSRGGRAA